MVNGSCLFELPSPTTCWLQALYPGVELIEVFIPGAKLSDYELFPESGTECIHKCLHLQAR